MHKTPCVRDGELNGAVDANKDAEIPRKNSHENLPLTALTRSSSLIRRAAPRETVALYASDGLGNRFRRDGNEQAVVSHFRSVSRPYQL